MPQSETAGGQTALAVDAFGGRVLSHYRLEQPLGSGGMGVLYRATDLKLGRAVAIKLLARHLVSDETSKARFVREARAASALDHPNIATVYEIGEQDSELFIAMALYEGETLKQRLEKDRFTVDEALTILRQVLLGLEAAHGAGIVHRDIKPANIMVTSKGTVKILDFGLAKLISDSQAETMTQTGQAMGTILYMSPEQLRCESVDSRSDLWSFGVLAYEVLTGASPFQTDSSAATVARILHDEPASLTTVPGVPDWLGHLVSKLLRKNPTERPQSAAEVLSTLNPSPQGVTARVRTRPGFAGARSGKYRQLLAAFVILGLGAGLYLYRRQSSSQNKINSLVVLPFVNSSGNADAEYLSDGITEGLINSLSQLPELRVIARTTAFRYKGKELDFQKLGRDLSVDAVLTGRVQQLPDSVVIQADLAKISTASQLWGERYERKLRDISVIQQELTRAISEKLRPRLTSEERHRLSTPETASPEAYQLCLRGRYFRNKGNKEAMEKSIEYFQQAIGLDPRYALAFAALSSVYASLAYYQYFLPEDALSKAEAAAQKALALDDGLAEAHSSLGFIKFQKWEWAAADAEFKRAIELNPNSATTRNEYGLYLTLIGHPEEALAQVKRAQQVDPASPEFVRRVGWILCRMGQYDLGIAGIKDALELEPNNAHHHYNLAIACYAQQKMYSEAVEEARKAVALGPSSPIYLGALGYVYAMMGNKAEALGALEELRKWDEKADASMSIARVYAGLGDHDNAIAWLEKAYQRRANRAIWLKEWIGFESLRSDPRFVDLLQRMGFPK